MIYVERHPNTEYRNYFVRAIVSRSYISNYDENKPELLKEMEFIPGVEEVSGHKYNVCLKIAPSFAWEEVEALALPLLHDYNMLNGANDPDRRVQYGPESPVRQRRFGEENESEFETLETLIGEPPTAEIEKDEN